MVAGTCTDSKRVYNRMSAQKVCAGDIVGGVCYGECADGKITSKRKCCDY
jgi:hypothetical protein